MTGARVIDGRYRLAEKIGHGGMGQVWAGYDERLDRRVAVKLLRTDLLVAAEAGAHARASVGATADGREGRDDLRRRFLRECRITAAMDHPGLVTVFDAGEDAGELYLVMQRVPGISLGDLIAEESPFPIDWAVAVAAQICAALSVVHAVPVVHRDLKPSNVMVRQDGRVVVLDLGIATALDREHTRLTMTGVPIGSPSYMAPEQALSGVVDPRSDLYALGCLLHEMLAGEEPFRAPTALGVLRRQVDEPPVPLRQLRAEVPAVLEALVLDLLAKRPADRPADAQEVHRRLLPMLPSPSGSVAPRPGPLPDPTAPYRHPHHPLAADRPAPPPYAAVPAPAAPAAPPSVPSGAYPAASPAAPSFPLTPTPPPGTAPTTDLAAACGAVSDLLAAHRYAEVIDLAARLLPVARAEHGDRAPLVRTLRTIYARTLLQERQYRAALPEYQLLATVAAADGGPHDPQALDHRRKAAGCLEQLGRGQEALAEYRALLAGHTARLEAGLDTDPERCFDLRERIGLLLAGAGDTEGAWEWLLALLFDREPRLGPRHPDVSRLRQHLDQLQHHRRTGPQPLDPRTGSWPTYGPAPGNPYRTGR
ncbi:serine/threonine-protein kinase [Kitasatospora mediocidica]|uniref:serine/threonine-protein kinase n=1 Tax=Kitasatospora mediocidica TaxID=58352 RepID=UPI0007C79266|nr:serine/threonine-protein kinase [Kitasatospora mediocidica]